MTINRENMLKWVLALESDKYTQARGQLAKTLVNGTVVGYCCLGVACAVSGDDTWDKDAAFLPRVVAGWLGVDNFDPVIAPADNGGETTATWANDTLHWSFDQIAAALRQTYDLGEREVTSVTQVETA